jgi:hypothetical protein
MKRTPHCCWSLKLVPARVMWSYEENRAIRPITSPPMAWVRPRRSRPQKGSRVFLQSAGGGGSALLPTGALPDGGLPGGGEEVTSRCRGPTYQCHPPGVLSQASTPRYLAMRTSNTSSRSSRA